MGAPELWRLDLEWASLGKLAASYARNSVDGVIVAVIDTGVDANHPVLKPAMLPGYDFTRGVAGRADDFADLDQSTSAILDQCRNAGLTQPTSAILDACKKTLRTSRPLPYSTAKA